MWIIDRSYEKLVSEYKKLSPFRTVYAKLLNGLYYKSLWQCPVLVNNCTGTLFIYFIDMKSEEILCKSMENKFLSQSCNTFEAHLHVIKYRVIIAWVWQREEENKKYVGWWFHFKIIQKSFVFKCKIRNNKKLLTKKISFSKYLFPSIYFQWLENQFVEHVPIHLMFHDLWLWLIEK